MVLGKEVLTVRIFLSRKSKGGLLVIIMLSNIN